MEALFGTSRTDSIKRSLTRAGYAFSSSGRGDNYTITITALPDPLSPFEEFAMREFKCGPQTNFKAMQTHFFLLFYHPDYQFLPSNHQAKHLLDNYGIEVSSQSLRNWQKKLIALNWITEDSEKVRYYICRKNHYPREITEDIYKQIWREFYSRAGKNENEGDLRIEIYRKYGGMPRKQCGFSENVLMLKELQELRDILENSM